MDPHDLPDRLDAQAAARLMDTLARVPPLFGRLHAVARDGPMADSEAALDATNPLGHHARILAMDHLSTGIEHLIAWQRLLAAGTQPYAAHLTLIRGAMEGAVTCRWLIDPRADSEERIRRGVALLVEDYGNRRDFERDFGIRSETIRPPAKTGADRFVELQKQRDEAKIGRIDVPKMTARFGGYVGRDPAQGRAIYRLLSAFAHGSQWKGLAVTMELVEGIPEPSGARVAKVSANDAVSVWMTMLGVRVAATAVAEVEGYCGMLAPEP